MKTLLSNLLIVLFIVSSSFSLSAQADNVVTSERTGVQRSQKQLMKRMDLFSSRTFKPFFYAEGNYGLKGTFSQDKVFTVSAPVSLGVGYRFSSKFSAGLRAGQSIYNSDVYYYDRSYRTAAKTRFQLVTAVANVHLPVGVRGEVYGGFGVGYQNTTVTALEESAQPKDADRRIVRPATGFIGTAQLGGRYSLTPTVSVQGEISSGLSTMSVGLRYRLR